ncbi:MAG: deoxyribonuclease V [Gammaproteobacteria bacterium]|nr:deoxyribonuclease V [Gammaproteobacteria bacterium]MCP5202092.1 deoxyribonuclease V [Gammaproteobacteria bacterium]
MHAAAEGDDWDLAPRDAAQRQRELAGQVVEADRFSAVRRIAGIDAGFPDDGQVTRVAVVVMSYPGLEVVEEVVVEAPTRFPYVPGLLSFREVPVMLEALARLARSPDILLVDGHGRAHPRRFGSACHLGVLCGIPSVGVGKSRLCGSHDEPDLERGAWTPLTHNEEAIGAVVRTRRKVSPVYVSVGHGVSLPSAIDLVLDCAPRYRLPEPIRAADKLATRK